MKRTSFRCASVVFSLLCALLILSVSLTVPIFCRPFYYAHIDALSLSEKTGYSYEQICRAYNEVLDYLTVPWQEFAMGDLSYSAEGAAHFADCKVLFLAVPMLLLLSTVALLLLSLLRRRRRWPMYTLARLPAPMWGAILATMPILIIGITVMVDFDTAFTVFHAVLFPGKSNWLMNIHTDPFVMLLPEQFFINCGLLIALIVMSVSVCILIFYILRKRFFQKSIYPLV